MQDVDLLFDVIVDDKGNDIKDSWFYYVALWSSNAADLRYCFHLTTYAIKNHSTAFPVEIIAPCTVDAMAT